MTLEANKAVVRKWIDAWVNRNLATLDELFAQDYVVNNSLVGIDGVKQSVMFLHSVMTNISVESDDLIAEGDKVVMRWTVRGKHVGEFLGVQPTGQLIKLHGINIYQLQGGKIIANHEQTNVLEVLQNLKAGR